MGVIQHFLDQRRLIDSNGIADGGTLGFYLAGTTTPTTIYSDAALTTPMTTPVVVGAGAVVPTIYLDSTISYKRVITYPDGSTDISDPYIPTNDTAFIPVVMNDDGTDQSSILAAAVTLSGITGITTLMIIGSGTFLIKDVLIPSNITLIGSGMNEVTLALAPGSLSHGMLYFDNASGAAVTSNVHITGITFDGQSANGSKNLIWMGPRIGDNNRIDFCRFKNCTTVQPIQGNPEEQLHGFFVEDCEFDNCPGGCIAFRADDLAVQGASKIYWLRNQTNNCGDGMFDLANRPPGYPSGVDDFWYDVRFDYNRLLNNSATGAFGAIPTQLWGLNGFSQCWNTIEGATRGLSASTGNKNGKIAFNLIQDQTSYAMEGGLSSNVDICFNIAINCRTFYSSTSTGSTIANVNITNNQVHGTGQTTSQSISSINLGNLGGDVLRDVRITDNLFTDLEFVQGAISVRGASGSNVYIGGNEYFARTANSSSRFITVIEQAFVSEDNYFERTAAHADAHYETGQAVYRYVGTLTNSGQRCISRRDEAHNSGAIGGTRTVYTMGSSESATARYGLYVQDFVCSGNWSTGPFLFADSGGETILDGFDISLLTTQTGVNNNINAAVPLGLNSGLALIRSGTYIKAGKREARERTYFYEPTSGVGSVVVRCDLSSGGQPNATFTVEWQGTQNNGTPQANRATIAFGNVSSPAVLPFTYQDGGTAVTLATAVTGGFAEATVTFPAHNSGFVRVRATAARTSAKAALSSYSVKVT
jgi:hypothetical protein